MLVTRLNQTTFRPRRLQIPLLQHESAELVIIKGHFFIKPLCLTCLFSIEYIEQRKFTAAAVYERNFHLYDGESFVKQDL